MSALSFAKRALIFFLIMNRLLPPFCPLHPELTQEEIQDAPLEFEMWLWQPDCCKGDVSLSEPNATPMEVDGQATEPSAKKVKLNLNLNCNQA